MTACALQLPHVMGPMPLLVLGLPQGRPGRWAATHLSHSYYLAHPPLLGFVTPTLIYSSTPNNHVIPAGI